MTENSKRRTLYLVDGPNLAFRAFFAIGGMANTQGLPTNALFGFTNMMLKLIREHKPDYLAIAWDPKGGSFREQVYPEYKGTRPDTPDGLRAQMPHFKRIADAFEIPYLCVENIEADDVLGTLARRYEKNLDIVLVTSDKDLMQMVSDQVRLYDGMKDRWISFAEVEEKFGCPPSLVPDALGIWGDSSDNIPGVKGVGEKGAKKLLAQWQGLDDIYEHIDEVAPAGVRNKLINDRENALLSRQLATIRTNAEVEVELQELALSYPPPAEKVSELFRELEFRSLLIELGGEMKTVDTSGYRLVTAADQLAAMAEALKAAGRFAVDTETTSLDAESAELVGISLCCEAKSAWYVPVGHQGLDSVDQLTWDQVKPVLQPIFEDESIAKTGQNLKYDLRVLAHHGVELRGIDGDTLIIDYLLAPDRRQHKLDELALLHLGHRMIAYSDTVAKDQSFASVPLEIALDYAAEDANVAWLLDQKLTPKLAELKLDTLYRELEVPLISTLASMESNGIALNLSVLEELDQELSVKITEAEESCYEHAGLRFNVGSVKQLRKILFDLLGLPVVKKTKTGASTNEAALIELTEHHPLPQAILDYRSLVKLHNTYVVPLPSLVNPATGRIHTHFSQATAATGRLASTDPNLQNIPIRTAEGRRIRQAFNAPPGRLLLSADYSQIELRILAHLCGGQGGFAEAFASGRDVHTETAAGLYEVTPGLVTREMRGLAKAVNFGIIYGQTAFGLAQSQRISRREAADHIKRFKERFPEIETFHQTTLEQAKEKGWVETLLGRRRPVPDLRSGNFVQRSQAQRVAVNTPVQGSAADLIKKAMIAVDRRLRQEFPNQLLLLQVHDELLLEVDEDQAEKVAEMVRYEMSSAMELLVPLVVDVGVGENWDAAH
jgi:DNA polymerase-1